MRALAGIAWSRLMFEGLEKLPPDPILGVSAAFRRDQSSVKVDLGVGVYRDAQGNTPVLAAVRAAEEVLARTQASKAYVGPAGNLDFNRQMTELALGPWAIANNERIAAIQTVGGCGALRLGGELIKATRADAVLHLSDPTWANHEPLLGSTGLATQRYPYYDPATRGVDFERMIGHLGRLDPGSVVLLHGCCHNPTGVDPDASEWSAIAELCSKRGLVPYVDLAYQGFGDDLETDVMGLRKIAEMAPEMLLAISCSKNFGLYRERTGVLVAIAGNASAAAAIATHQARIARRIYSMPPDHGAAVVAAILADATLGESWRNELTAMVVRMKLLRQKLADGLAARRPDRDFGWLTAQRGMFSLLGIDEESIARLREEWHVYLPPDGRMNVAGLSEAGVDYVADSVAPLIP
jgi:aspartate aminotransferase